MAEPQTLTVSAVSAPGSAPFAISFTGLGGHEFASEQDFRDWATSVYEDSIMRRLLAAWWMGHDPTLTTPSILLNATLTVEAQGGFSIQVGG